MTAACSMASSWILRSRALWHDLPETYGPYTTCYNRFVRWRQAGIWDQIMEALAAGHDAAVQMIDTSVVRVHQHGVCVAHNNHQDMGRSRGGLTSEVHAVVATACRSILLSRPVRRTTIGCVRFFSAPCFRKRCDSRIAATTQTGSGSLPPARSMGEHSAETKS